MGTAWVCCKNSKGQHSRIPSRSCSALMFVRQPLKSKGYYASWLLSAFMIGALLTSYAWGMFADRFGRKPVLLIGLCATSVFAITFGLSESFAAALASRCAQFVVCVCVSVVSHLFWTPPLHHYVYVGVSAGFTHTGRRLSHVSFVPLGVNLVSITRYLLLCYHYIEVPVPYTALTFTWYYVGARRIDRNSVLSYCFGQPRTECEQRYLIPNFCAWSSRTECNC